MCVQSACTLVGMDTKLLHLYISQFTEKEEKKYSIHVHVLPLTT